VRIGHERGGWPDGVLPALAACAGMKIGHGKGSKRKSLEEGIRSTQKKQNETLIVASTRRRKKRGEVMQKTGLLQLPDGGKGTSSSAARRQRII